MAEVKDVVGKKRIQMQLGIPFFTLIAFFLTVLIFGTLYFANVFKADGVEIDPKDVAEQSLKTTNSFFESIETSVAEVISALESSTNREDGLRQALASNRSILAVFGYDESGVQAFELHKSRVTNETLGKYVDGARYIALDRQSENRYIEYQNGSLVFTLQPYGQNSFLGVLFTTEELENILKNDALKNQTRILIVNARTASTLFEVSTLEFGAEDVGPQREDILSFFENQKNKYGYVTETGKRFRGHWLPLGSTGYVVMAESPILPTPPVNTSVYFVAAIILVILIALVFYYLYVFNQKLATPLKKIERVMHYFETGDYSEQMEVHSKNEFAELASLMNRMAHNVENNTSERVSQLKKVLDRQNTDTKLLIEKDVELREQGQKLKELDAAKSMFVSVAAHQMRTPLSAIKWSLKLVLDGDVGPVNAEQKEYLNKGYESTTRMIDLINDLLDVDKIESDKFTYEFKEQQLEDVIQGIIDDLTPMSKDKGVNLQYQKTEAKYPSINADQVKLRNALQNLIDNAIKYTIGGGDVTVRLALEGSAFKLSISDTGIGIPVSEQGKVFGKFFRAKNAVRQETDGSGLGLFIVKKILEKHGGNITFESKEAKGTTFFIDLPVMEKGS